MSVVLELLVKFSWAPGIGNAVALGADASAVEAMEANSTAVDDDASPSSKTDDPP